MKLSTENADGIQAKQQSISKTVQIWKSKAAVSEKHEK